MESTRKILLWKMNKGAMCSLSIVPASLHIYGPKKMRRLVCHDFEWEESSSCEYDNHFSNAQLFHTVKGYVGFVLWAGYLTILQREYYRYKEV